MTTLTNSSASASEHCACPYCAADDGAFWAAERGFTTVKCKACGFLYLTPRPNSAEREKATQLGVHGAADDMDISERYLPTKVKSYADTLRAAFPDVWISGRAITWLDIGAGYGEFVEAVKNLAAAGSTVRGLEPMVVKAKAAQARGLDIIPEFIGPTTPKTQFASLINVFSHINDFDAFLEDIVSVLEPRGEVFIETGDMGGVQKREEFPGELGSPDHVAFASEQHMRGFLERHGFQVVSVQKASIDGYGYAVKNAVKKLLGRNVRLALPHASPYRTMRVRARKVK